MPAVPTGHIVEEFYIGKTHVRFCDDYCKNTTQEEIDRILERIEQIYIKSCKRKYRAEHGLDENAPVHVRYA